jgi:predicted protein tyrosine phosphatase
MRLLFVCRQNKLRSPTAEIVFSEYEGVEALSAGTAREAETTLSPDLLEWADFIFAMENRHRDRIRERFGKLVNDKRLIVLGIPDNYEFMQPELIALLKEKVSPHLPGIPSAEIPGRARSEQQKARSS